MTFRIGQKVVCIDADGASELVLHRVYTVTAVIPPTRDRWRGAVSYWSGLELYEAEPDPWFQCFCSERFRPAVEKTTDISIFTEMLTREKIEA